MADEPIVSGMAGRYATALFELAQEEKAVDSVLADLNKFAELLNGSPDLLRLVRSPVFKSDEQLKALQAVLAKAGVSGLAGKFLAMVTKNRRLFAVQQMIGAYRAIVSRHKGEARAQVTVAEKLSDEHLSALKDALKSATKQDVSLDMTVDPSILGGMKVKLGSRMVDASLKTKLNSIRIAMKEAR